MYVVKISCIVVIIVVNDVVGKSVDSISISDDKVSWEKAVGSGHTILSSDFVLKHGWNSTLFYTPDTSSGARYWIGARANHTQFVSWEGCVQWIGETDCGDLYPGGSIGECIQNCNADLNYFILKDSSCRCVHRNYTNCFNYTYDRCDRSCPNNPNDWCGGTDDVMSLYFTGPYNYTVFETIDGSEGNCAVLIYHNTEITNISTHFKSRSCWNNRTRRYICKNDTSAYSYDNKRTLGWSEAVEQCRLRRSRPNFYISSEKINGSVFWTSLRRSIHLKWTNKKDEDFPFCVSLSVDNTTVHLHEEPCDKEQRYLYLDDDHIWWRWLYLLIIVPVAGILVITCRVLLSRKSSKDGISPRKPVKRNPVSAEPINNTAENIQSASAPRYLYHELEIVDSDANTTNGDCGARNVNEMSVYDTTLNSRNRGGAPRLVSDPGTMYNTTISRGAVGIVQNSNNVYNTTLCGSFNTNVNSLHRGFVPRLTSDPGSVYDSTRRGAVGIAQNSNNVYNTTLCRNIGGDYVSCNVYGSGKKKDIDVYDNADTLSPEMAGHIETDAYDVTGF